MRYSTQPSAQPVFLDYSTTHWPTAIGKAVVEPRPDVDYWETYWEILVLVVRIHPPLPI